MLLPTGAGRAAADESEGPLPPWSTVSHDSVTVRGEDPGSPGTAVNPIRASHPMPSIGMPGSGGLGLGAHGRQESSAPFPREGAASPGKEQGRVIRKTSGPSDIPADPKSRTSGRGRSGTGHGSPILCFGPASRSLRAGRKIAQSPPPSPLVRFVRSRGGSGTHRSRPGAGLASLGSGSPSPVRRDEPLRPTETDQSRSSARSGSER